MFKTRTLMDFGEDVGKLSTRTTYQASLISKKGEIIPIGMLMGDIDVEGCYSMLPKINVEQLEELGYNFTDEPIEDQYFLLKPIAAPHNFYDERYFEIIGCDGNRFIEAESTKAGNSCLRLHAKKK